MNIAIWMGLCLEGARGITLYQEHLAAALADIDARNDYCLFSYFFRDFERKKALIRVPPRPNFRPAIHRWPESLINPLLYGWDLPLFWPTLKASGVTLFHSTSMLTPILPGIRTVTTVHDIMPVLFPQWGGDPGHARRYRRWLMRADRIICVSRHTRQDIVRHLGIPEEKTAVIPLGVDTAVFRPPESAEAIGPLRRRYGLPERYVFSMGPFEPRRNLGLLVRVFQELLATPEGRGLGLVIGGARSGTYAEVQELVRAAGLSERVCFPGYVPTADLAGLHAGAELFIYPSLYEGFGLSPLEALACGTPVVSSDSSSLPEILDGCAALADPQDPAAFVRASLELLRNSDLRRTRREAGLRRAAELTWRRMAERTLAVYESASR